MNRPVRKVVIPAAGLGTRFLPASKIVPKEMLPVVDRPVIQYGIEEALAAGIEHIVLVTSRGKESLADHFDRHQELNDTLAARGKTDLLEEVLAGELPPGSFSVVRQPQPLGLGHAVWCARHVVSDGPFAVLLPDDVFMAETPVLRQMVDAYGETGGNIVAAVEVPRDRTDRYGILEVGADDGRLAEIRGMVEKPKPEDAPSTLSIVGRYILQPEIFAELDRKERGAGNEIQLTDAMARLIGRQPFHGLRYQGHRFDCGDKAGFVAANLAFALARDDLAEAVQATLADILPQS